MNEPTPYVRKFFAGMGAGALAGIRSPVRLRPPYNPIKPEIAYLIRTTQ